LLQRLKGWVVHFSKSRHSRTALFLIAFAESSFFPIPPDVLLIALVLIQPQKWWVDAGVCLAGSVLGGMLGYVIGWQFWLATHEFFFQYVFSPEAFETVKALYQRHEFWTIFTAGFTPIPYKIFTITAGVCTINFPIFVLASVISRGARFFIVALLLRLFGERIKQFLEKHFNWLTLVFVVLLVGGFVLVKYLTH